MKKNICIFLLLSAAFLLQSAVFPRIPYLTASPNLMLILVIAFGLIRGSRAGLWIGFWCGMLCDLFFGYYLGIYALLYMYAGAISGIFQKRFYSDDIKFPLFLVGVVDLFSNLVVYFFLFYLRGKENISYYFRHAILPECIFTIVAMIFIYIFLLRFNEWLDSAERA